MNLPVYRISIDDETGVDFVALVEDPAIKLGYQRLSSESAPEPSYIKFQANAEKQILSGPLLVADLPVYRKQSGSMPEHYIVFDAQTITSIAQKFFRDSKHLQINLNHDASLKVNDSYFFESFLIDRNRGINPPKGYESLSNGSWFVSLKIDNKDTWDIVKREDFNGFSIEGFLNQTLVNMAANSSAPVEVLSLNKIYKQIADLVEEGLKQEN